MKKIFTSAIFILFVASAFAQGTWTSRASIVGSTPRYRAASFVVNGKCYVGSGSSGANVTMKDFWSYDPAMNTWTQVADLSGSSRMNATGAGLGDFGYVGLGVNGGSPMNDWWQYSPDSNAWIQKASFPGHERYGAGSFSLDGRIFVGGGIDSSNVVYSDFYAYDAINDQWVTRQVMPVAVTAMAAFTIGTKGYFVGGALNGSVSATTQNNEYDPIADTWTPRAAFAGGNIFSCVGFSIDNYGYVGTGFSGNLTDILYRFDPVADSWTQETDFPGGIRQWGVVCNVNNRAFFGTGNSTGGNLYNDFWEFVPMTTAVNETIDNCTIYFDQTMHQLIIKGAKGTEKVKLFSADGKIIAVYDVHRGTNSFYINTGGLFFAHISNGMKNDVLKILNVE